MGSLEACIRFNTLKHHFAFLKCRIKEWHAYPIHYVLPEIQELGSNQFDVYTGALTIGEILGEVNIQLSAFSIADSGHLASWIGKRGYRTLRLSDGSCWVIRVGEDPAKFIHLHPCRQQQLVTRIKANHLKTAIILILGNHIPGPAGFSTSLINEIRREILGLSPVKSVADSRKIMDAYRFLA